MVTINKTLKSFDFDKSDIKEVRLNMIKKTDFEINDYRFIHADDIDDILSDELQSDLYILGSFNAWFIADILDLDIKVIEMMQECNGYEALGKMLVRHIDTVVEQYIKHDGYGHHFGHYDGNEHEFGDWYFFRVN
jgi:hypothetical protein|tara:strand:+ start:610 stop:1014 length:405 start_codon:yes stop_codon:yes gene_type:complete